MSGIVRLGCVVPAHNVMVERDFHAMCPTAASVHVARADIDYDRPLEGQLRGMIENAPAAAARLAKAEMAAIAFACTSASFLDGPGSDRRIAADLQAVSGVPAITTSTAVVEALQALGVRRIAMATPYRQWVMDAEKAFLAAAGIEVVAMSGMELGRPADINAVPLAEVIDAAIAIDRPEAQAIFISCTDLDGRRAIEHVEAHCGKPVISSNQACFWALCRLAGVTPPPGPGRLMRH